MNVWGQHSRYSLEEISESDKDLIIKLVLLLLPVNMLMRFSCVSRYWFNWINNQDFTSWYLHYNMTNNDKLNVFVSSRTVYGEKIINRLGSVDDSPNQDVQPVYSERFKKGYEIVGSCNGLMCLYCDVRFKLALWNPFKRIYKMLPTAEVSKILRGEQRRSHGFGYDKKGNDYKVVQIIQSFQRGNLLGTKVQVYSLTSNSWTEVEHFPFVWFDFPKNGCFLNGALYWLALRRNKPNAKHLLVRFELEVKKFDKLKVPNVDSVDELHLGVLGDCLSVCASTEGFSTTLIWTAQNGEPCTWIKQPSVVFEDSDNTGNIRTLAYTDKGKKLLLTMGFKTLVWYDLRYKEYNKFFLPRYTTGFQVATCIESLESLGVDSKADV